MYFLDFTVLIVYNGYANKFMDLISSRFISDTFKEIYPGYIYYADRQVNKRVRKKGV